MRNLRKCLFIAYFFVMMFATLVSAQASIRTVFISKTADHPALDQTVQGVIDGLKQNGYVVNKNLKIQIESAQANTVLAAQIATKFISQNPDVVVGVGTMSAQSFSKYANAGKAKLIFSSVTDPLAVNLVQSLDKPGVNVSGVSNFMILDPQLKLFKRLQPKLKRLGFLYNPGEINSVSILAKLKEVCATMNITVVTQVATKTADVAQSAIKLADGVDAIFISNDNTALSSLQSIVKAAIAAKIPVYVSDNDIVADGALAALGPNQYEVGLQTGKMVADVLNGQNLAIMPVQFPSGSEIYVNLIAAKKIGISIPEDIIRDAAKIIK